MPKYLKSSRREQLLLHQVHAYEHYLASLGTGPRCQGGFPQLDGITHFKCPICARRVVRADWSEDHAPVQNRTSTQGILTLGAATTCVLTCWPCNNEPGHTYEWQATVNSRHPPLGIDMPGMTCEVHGEARVQEHQPTGLYVVRDETPFVRTDFKAAYLLAFAALGYTWAFSPGVRPIRAALPPAARPPDARHGYMMRSILRSPTANSDNVVIEVVHPEPCVIVRAATGASVVLPSVGHLTVPRVDGNIGGYIYPWPRTAGNAIEIDKTHRDGELFHLDFCNTTGHVRPTLGGRWPLAE